MEPIKFVTQVVTSPSIKFRFKYTIFILALLLSVAFYRYIVDYFSQEKDFISMVLEMLPINNRTYEFWSHANTVDDASIYAKLAKAMESEQGSLKISIKGSKGIALDNAFGVLNTSKSFGIIQDDTYINADFVKNDNKIKEITKLYMERLHILCIDKPERLKNINKISSKDIESIKLITDAIDQGTFFAGKSQASARILLPHLLETWGIKNAYKLPGGSNHSMEEMIDEILNQDSEIGYPRIAIFFVGTNIEIIEKLYRGINSKEVKLLGVSPIDIRKVNELQEVDLEITNFGQAYDKYKDVPTAGSFATLIGSKDLTPKEIYQFLSILDKVIKDAEFKDIFDNPPIPLRDVKEFYQEDDKKGNFTFLRSLIIFITAIIISTFLFSNLILNIISTGKQSIYYKNIIEVYRTLSKINKTNINMDKSPEYQFQYSKAIQIKEGILKFEEIGWKIREDYNTGGITINHHKYLMENLNHVFVWFEKKLTYRLTFVISKMPNEIADEIGLKDTILQWHSNGLLSTNSFDFLMRRFKIKREA